MPAAFGKAVVRNSLGRRRRSLIKALTWRITGSLDTFVLSFAILAMFGASLGVDDASVGASAEASGKIAIAEIVTKIAIYYLHERAWDHVRLGLAERNGRLSETRWRSLTKTATWRVIASADTTLLAYIFTGSIGAALSIGLLETLTKLGLYFLHERLWNRISWR